MGLGPKGLFALERLLDHAGHGAGLEVDGYEPHPVPGAGPNYDPRQPQYLRMNFPARQVNMWWPGGGAVPQAERRSFVEWAGSMPDEYPARARVGRYLADGLGRILRSTPETATVNIHPRSVAAVERQPAGWLVEDRVYDEVLIATGHEPGSVYPVDVWLSPKRVPPGARVAARGFALTFIDAALALTEGRGGRFERLDHPFRLRYLPGGDDVGVIYPWSRTGRPMLPKPSVEPGGAEPIIGGRARAHPQARP